MLKTKWLEIIEETDEIKLMLMQILDTLRTERTIKISISSRPASYSITLKDKQLVIDVENNKRKNVRHHILILKKGESHYPTCWEDG